MPVIFRIGPFKICIYSDDHPPAHVHCKASDCEVLIELKTGKVRKNFGVHSSDLKKLQKFIKENSDVFMTEWEHYHGKD